MNDAIFNLIYESKLFNVVTLKKPHIDRGDGGRVVIIPKRELTDRTQLNTEEAGELIKLSMVVGEAMKTAMNKRGVDIQRINFQENGNWTPRMHLHLYGRANSAKIQKFGESLNFPKPETGFYEKNQPLEKEDIDEIREEIVKVLQRPKYKNF